MLVSPFAPMPDAVAVLIHASCVAIDGLGVLLLGPPGAGKSDLALRLLDHGARLVSDDQTELNRQENRLIARAPATLHGLLEVRGIGIVNVEALSEVPVALAIDLVPGDSIERMPEPAKVRLLDFEVPLFRLDPFQASAPAKLRLAVRATEGSIMVER